MGDLHRMISQGVYRVDSLDSVNGLSMTFKGVLLCLTLCTRVKELDGDSSLNGGGSIAETIPHTTNHPRLILERAFPTLKGLVHVSEIINKHQPSRHRHHQLLITDIQGEDLFRLLVFAEVMSMLHSSCAMIPRSYSLVPGPCHQKVYNTFSRNTRRG